ncbi:MAG: transcriptional regulator EpsA [Burkholderiales bacterium]|nr:transcriptional regulator EpsA [Burkholderiales bacterium]
MPNPHLTRRDDAKRVFALMQQALSVRRHLDLLVWLQGDMQHFLPHQIMVASWGDFRLGLVHHDIVSRMSGVRTANCPPEEVAPLLSGLFARWTELEKKPFAMRVGESGFGSAAAAGIFGRAVGGMPYALIHGISDERGRHDCLYALFGTEPLTSDRSRAAFELLLPHIDTALRQVPPLRAEAAAPADADEPEAAFPDSGTLSSRESEIMAWVKKGKTNHEIGAILDISAFTVKNHLKRIFRKLDVYNRVQAVNRLEGASADGAH